LLGCHLVQVHKRHTRTNHIDDRFLNFQNSFINLGLSIGKFGVGFKSVFAYTQNPEIHSGEYHFRIHDLVVPELLPPTSSDANSFKTKFIFHIEIRRQCFYCRALLRATWARKWAKTALTTALPHLIT
jgi:hypothetical protein